MKTHFHGVDKHSTHLTITTIIESGEIVQFKSRCEDFQGYIRTLSESDAIAIESGNMTFFIADAMEKTGASVYVIYPRRFSIITKSTKKTDKNDSVSLAFSLRNFIQDIAMAALPLVYKPEKEIRELRRMFSGHETLKKSMIQLKNTIIGMIRDTGYRISNDEKKLLFHPKKGMEKLEELGLLGPDYTVIKALLISLHSLMVQKEYLKDEIVCFGGFLKKEVTLLISIKGVSPFLALAFLADIGDISRFKNIRKLNAYLGVVPVTRSSGKHTFQGHIIRSSRSLTRTLFTQAVPHIGKSSESISKWYSSVRKRRGTGRGRIALVRKIVKIMRRMLLEQELYRWCDQESYKIKLVSYNRILKKKEATQTKVA